MENKILNELILTAGPYITEDEALCAADAAAYGWNSNWNSYLLQFENIFKNYIGALYALPTSSCTGALHLCLKALGVQPGDEVIVPEITWIATASAVIYVGATPVFADVDKDTWTLCPESVRRLITSKTRAIIPVHLYGHSCEMEPLWELAKKYDLKILEDAAQSIGTLYYGKRTGTLGNMGAFSFQGAKSIVTGEGGMLVTNDESLLNKAFYYGDHGRDSTKILYNTGIGYKYKMANVTASVGYAQMQKADEIIAKKRIIFNWYRERLQDIEHLQLNCEKKNTVNSFWMTSIVLPKVGKYTRDSFINALKERKIDSRPMFYPLSSFSMFSKKDNPNAYHIGTHGINLPSGHNLEEEEIDYICYHIRELMGFNNGQKTGSVQPWGWISNRDKIKNQFYKIKEEGLKIPFIIGENQFYLQALTHDSLENDKEINLLTNWRLNNQNAFAQNFKVTFDGTKKWLQNMLIREQDRILFFILGPENLFIGHIGLFRFNWKLQECELDNVIRGVKNVHPGVMQISCQTLIDWAKRTLCLKNIFLKVLSDNSKALDFYTKLGFREINRIPLIKRHTMDGHIWKQIVFPEHRNIDNYFITMKLF